LGYRERIQKRMGGAEMKNSRRRRRNADGDGRERNEVKKGEEEGTVVDAALYDCRALLPVSFFILHHHSLFLLLSLFSPLSFFLFSSCCCIVVVVKSICKFYSFCFVVVFAISAIYMLLSLFSL